jgi:hypothetical protein
MALSGFLESGKKTGVNGQNDGANGSSHFDSVRRFKNFNFLFTM